MKSIVSMYNYRTMYILGMCIRLCIRYVYKILDMYIRY